jgi:UDP-glucose 4-epimerase
MKILVTGGAGFIGSNIVDKYVKLGHNVVIVDDLSNGKKEHINPKAKFYKLDIREDGLERIFKAERPDIVNHHAAQIDVRKSVEDPKLDASINIGGMINIGRNCIKYGVKKLIFASSGGAIYGETKSPAKEDAVVRPISPYAINKYTAELYLQYWKEAYGLNYTLLRYSNVYGPRQAGGEAGVISIFIQNMRANKPITIYGNGKQIRDYVYVGDVASANVSALTKGNGSTYNIGTKEGTSVNELFKELCKLTGYNKTPRYAPPRQGEVFRSILNAEKAKKELGITPIPLKEGLNRTVQWFKEQS